MTPIGIVACESLLAGFTLKFIYAGCDAGLQSDGAGGIAHCPCVLCETLGQPLLRTRDHDCVADAMLIVVIVTFAPGSLSELQKKSVWK